MPASKTDAELLIQGGREVEINGETKILFFNHRALRNMEREIASAGFEDGLESIGPNYKSVTMIGIMLWAGLLHYEVSSNEKGPTIDGWMDSILDSHDNMVGGLTTTGSLAGPIFEAFARVRPEIDGEPKAPLAAKKKKKSVTKKSGKGS